MLSSFLDEHPLISLMEGTGGCPFPSMDDRAAWDGLPEAVRQELKELAARYREVPYPLLPATAFMAFVRSGSRAAYETPYFTRRRKLASALLGCCVTGTEDDLDAVIDGLWCICEESSWVISAHNGSSHEGMRPAKERPLPDVQNPYIDLFAAQTAMILSFVCAMLGPQLDRQAPVLRRRVRLEIERRILVPFMTRDDYWWMGFIRRDLCNWTPWIISNVMLTATIWVDDRLRLAELLERGCRMLDRFLAILPEDGGCDEGAGYWDMAGGALLDCLELLERVTGGRMTFWDDPKLRAVLRFPALMQLEKGWFVNFADCDARPLLCGERLQLAGERIGDARLVTVGSGLRGHLADRLGDTAQLWRLLNQVFHAPAGGTTEAALSRDVWLPDLQVRVLERSRSILVAKGGHNGESHNHNDVGSFMLYVDGDPVLVDAGNMTYTATTFSDARYTLWNVRSLYHNVPLIGGMEQQPGRSFRADHAEASPDGVAVSFASAYDPRSGVTRCHRVLCLDTAGTLTLRDSIETRAPQPVTWSFMLRYPPERDGNALRIGPVRMELPESPALTMTVEELPITDPRMARCFPGSLWHVMLTAPEALSHEATFVIRRCSDDESGSK